VFRVAACSSVCLSIFALVPLAQSQTYQGRELVKAELLADTNAVVPGKPFTVGLLLRMAPHWHTYWKFSGDAGIPTELKWKLPPGWKAGEIQWPIPLKTIDPGDIQTYGYQDEVLLMQEITPPVSISDSTVKLSADATWLVCEKICIPGNASLQLELPKSTTSASANTEIFTRFRRLLPQNWPEPKVATANWTRAGSDLRLSVKSATLANYPRADFYPLPEGETVVGHPKVESRSANEVVFRVPNESASKDLSSIQGLIVFGQSLDGPDRAAWQTPASTIASASSAPSRGILTFLFFGFLGGIILNLMPCVLPVISLKIFGFIQQAGQSRQKILRSGIAFAAGIFAWFIGLALLLIALKAAGREITWGGFQFTNPYFVLALSVIVLVFALNLFGVFEISLPQGVTRGLLSSTSGQHEAGSFFQGLFATILATPCTAPFLGTALGFAFAQSPAIILLMFVAIAAGTVFAALRTTGLAALSAKAGSMDAARETVHGIPAAGDAALSSLRARRATWSRRGDLGKLLFAGHQHRMLDERRIRSTDRVSRKANSRARAHASACPREWRLFHRREISLSKYCFGRFTAPGRLAGIHARAFANGVRTGPFCICRFHCCVVSHLQI